MANYVIGDIQACYSALCKLLDNVHFDPKQDKLWAVGDLIGRGSEAVETLAFLYSLGDAFDCVLGNHDLHFLAVYCGLKADKPADKLTKLLTHQDSEHYVNWLRQKPLAIALTPQCLLTHAGLYPQWSFARALELSGEVQAYLQADNWRQLLEMMYGSEPHTWQDSLSGFARLRFIINAFTRMRFIQHKDALEFAHKGEVSQAPPGLTPWFRIDNPHLQDKQKVVFGHWAALAGNTGDDRFIALDTGFIWGQQLTILNLENHLRSSLSHA